MEAKALSAADVGNPASGSLHSYHSTTERSAPIRRGGESARSRSVGDGRKADEH